MTNTYHIEITCEICIALLSFKSLLNVLFSAVTISINIVINKAFHTAVDHLDCLRAFSLSFFETRFLGGVLAISVIAAFPALALFFLFFAHFPITNPIKQATDNMTHDSKV